MFNMRNIFIFTCLISFFSADTFAAKTKFHANNTRFTKKSSLKNIKPAQLRAAQVYRESLAQRELPPNIYREIVFLVDVAKPTLKVVAHVKVKRSHDRNMPAYALIQEIYICPFDWKISSKGWKAYTVYHELSHVFFKHSAKRGQMFAVIYGSRGDLAQQTRRFQAFCRAQEKEADIHALNGLLKNRRLDGILAYIQVMKDWQRVGIMQPDLDHPGVKETLALCYQVLQKNKKRK